MAQWGPTDQANNSPNWAAASINEGKGRTAQAANNTALYGNVSGGVFKPRGVMGTFGVSRAEMANTGGEKKRVSHVGWQMRRAGMGPIKTLVANGGSFFANGETVLISNGSINCTANLTCNATGNLVSGAITSNAGGIFVNANAITVAFNREKHLNNINVTGGSGYNNTDTILVSNAAGFVNGTATISTNSIGGFANGGITLTNVGLFANVSANTDMVLTVLAANGAASNGSLAVLAANLRTSATGTVTVGTMGGRAGRVHYECLVAMTSLSNGATDDTYFPT